MFKTNLDSRNSLEQAKNLMGMISVLLLPGLLLALANSDLLFFALIMADSAAGVGLGVWLARHKRASLTKESFTSADYTDHQSKKDIKSKKDDDKKKAA